MASNQKVSESALDYGKKLGLTKELESQFAEHVLHHQDKTGRAPTPTQLDTIYVAVVIHNMPDEREHVLSKAEASTGVKKYRALVEQKALIEKTTEVHTGLSALKILSKSKVKDLEQVMKVQKKHNFQASHIPQRGLDI